MNAGIGLVRQRACGKRGYRFAGQQAIANGARLRRSLRIFHYDKSRSRNSSEFECEIERLSVSQKAQLHGFTGFLAAQTAFRTRWHAFAVP